MLEMKQTFESFLSHFCESSGTLYNKTSQTDTVGKKTVLSGVRKCIHTVNKSQICAQRKEPRPITAYWAIGN